MKQQENQSLFEKQSIEIFDTLGIDPNDAVFVGKTPFSRYLRNNLKNPSKENEDALLQKLLKKRAKLFVCRPEYSEGLYCLAPPEHARFGGKSRRKPGRTLKKPFAELEKRFLAANNSILREIMLNAKKNAEFIERFNRELFFKNVRYMGKRLSEDELFALCETETYRGKIDLSSRKDKTAFCAMFAIAYYQCGLEDLYTIDSIFSLQPSRCADNSKKAAGNDVFNMIFRNDKDEINRALERIGVALTKLKPPSVNLSDVKFLAENYSLWSGISEIGTLFSRIFTYNGKRELDEALKTAESFKRCGEVAALCEKISRLSDSEDYRETAEYQKVLYGAAYAKS
jgi:hypothetical protein